MTDAALLKRIAAIPNIGPDCAYELGRDCALHGANEQNCHFAIFATTANTAAWERGQKEARNDPT